MSIENVIDARWLNDDHTRLECNYKHEVYGWIPFTADINDKSPTSTYIFDHIDEIDVEEFNAPITDLAIIKEAKHIELRQTREFTRTVEFAIYDNDTFQIRKEDQDNMNTFYADSVAMLSGVVTRESFTIMSATNRPHTFTPEQIVQLSKIMKAKVEEIYRRYWYARDVLLAKAATPEQVMEITFPDKLPS